MAALTWRQLHRRVERLRVLTAAPELVSRTGFAIEMAGPGCTTIKPGNLDTVEDLKHDLENLYIWLWSIKDYLINMLVAKGVGPAIAKRMVEDYVGINPGLKLVADVANSAKHASLDRSRSGQFASIGSYVTTAPILMPWQNNDEAQRRLRNESDAYISIENDKGENIGDAAKIALDAIQTWERFVAKHRL